MASAKKLDLVLVNPGSRKQVYQSLGSKLAAADFDVTSVDGVAMLDSDAANSGMRALADLVRDFVPGHGGVSASEASEWFDDLEQVAKRGDYFLCVTGFLFTATRS